MIRVGSSTCPGCDGRRERQPCEVCDSRRRLVWYRCPLCRGEAQGHGPGALAGSCEVCRGEGRIEERIAEVWREGGLEGYRRWWAALLG